MKRQDIYRFLESTMLSYTDYAAIPVQPVNEVLMAIAHNSNLTTRQIDRTMLAYTGEKVYVRQTVAKKLQEASALLAQFDRTLQLEVVYGYRALAVQQQLFEDNKTKLQHRYQGEKLLAATHRLVAVPTVAGHPAGAAVDIQIIKEGKPLDFGTTMHQFAPDTFTFSPFISPAAWQNRQLLRRVMLTVGFAPFDGEWWHFSYGDKEWAKYYNQPTAKYQQIQFSTSQS